MYDTVSCPQETSPKPTKAMMNLVISVSSLIFNPIEETWAVPSEKMKEAVRSSHWVTTLPEQYFQTSQSLKRRIFFIPWIFLLEVDILPCQHIRLVPLVNAFLSFFFFLRQFSFANPVVQ